MLNSNISKIRKAAWAKHCPDSSFYNTLLRDRKDVISLALGLPDNVMIPQNDLREGLAVFAKDFCSNFFQYQTADSELRKHIMGLIGLRGVEATMDEIVVTNGAQQAISLMTQLLCDHESSIIVEEASYHGLSLCLTTCSPKIHTVPTHRDTGIDVDRVEELLVSGVRPNFIYLIPEGHNPTGVTISLDKRKKLVALAKKYDFMIIEDDAYGFLQYTASPNSSMRSICRERVISIGSFSKILAPSLRVGWIHCPADLISQIVFLKDAQTLHATSLNQFFLSYFLSNWSIYKKLDMLRVRYQEKRDLTLKALSQSLPEVVTYSAPHGGFFVWLSLPSWVNTVAPLEVAIENYGISYLPGSFTSFGCEDNNSNCIRISFANQDDEKLQLAIEKLGDFIESIVR